MQENDSHSREQKPTAGGVISLVALVALGAGVAKGAVEVGDTAIKEARQEQFAKFDPSKEAEILKKARIESDGGGHFQPGAGKAPGVYVPGTTEGDRFVLVFGQEVRNGDGDRATAKGRMFVDEATFNEHEERERIAPDEIEPGAFQQIDEWTQRIKED